MSFDMDQKKWDKIGGRTIWHRTIWHQDSKNEQFGTKTAKIQFGTKIKKVDNLAPGQFGTGQFGTKLLI